MVNIPNDVRDFAVERMEEAYDATYESCDVGNAMFDAAMKALYEAGFRLVPLSAEKDRIVAGMVAMLQHLDKEWPRQAPFVEGQELTEEEAIDRYMRIGRSLMVSDEFEAAWSAMVNYKPGDITWQEQES